jgi:DNA helicase-2/ATP-dependent DNA helicase PcrA
LLTGAIWGDGSSPRAPSRFLLEVAGLAERPRSGVVQGEWAEEPPEGAVNPRDSLTRSVVWPIDPLGDRRPGLEAAAALVRAAETVVAQGKPLLGPPMDDWPVDPDWSREVDALLAERATSAVARLEVELPSHLSASQLVALARDPLALAGRLRRPMPEPPSPQTRRGSAFHAWLEQRFGWAALVDVDDLPGAADDGAADDDELAALQEQFLASPWAERSPEFVEVSIETPVGEVSVRGRIDAVFRVAAGSGEVRWEVVDWKTGPPPLSASAARARAVQLAVYRTAWARLTDVPVHHVSAAFFYAATGETVRPVDLLDVAALSELVASAVTTSG